ncbi:MAG: ATP-binding cassette domain-containing protein [Thermodesulfobacteriota bacterium]|nr:ATP-binding cassette domain-containing protein [Thermodesulfobacteriota bacterium]
MNSRPVINVDRLSYSYRKTGGQWILKKLNLTIQRGEYLLISGGSGCGKSTLCRTFNGLIPHFYGGRMKGSVDIAGIPTTAKTIGDLFTQVGMVFQNPEAQLFSATVEREIAFGLESLGLPRPEIKSRIVATAGEIGLTDLLNRSPHDLSGGEQYLAAIAAVLAVNPRLIILDEPYANLDSTHGLQLRKMLKKINRRGTAVVICEHRLAPTIPDAGRMIVLHEGRVALDGLPATVLAENVDDYGLFIPSVVQASRQMKLTPLPLSVAEFKSALNDSELAFEIKPVAPVSVSANARTVLKVDKMSSNLSSGFALKNIDFSLKEGECLALLGGNGAGKTTLARHLNGLLRPDTGRIHIMGQVTDRMKTSDLARYIGLAFQNPHNQFFKQTVRHEIEVGPRALNCHDPRWMNLLVELFRLAPLMNRPPYRLSAGEKKTGRFCGSPGGQSTDPGIG